MSSFAESPAQRTQSQATDTQRKADLAAIQQQITANLPALQAEGDRLIASGQTRGNFLPNWKGRAMGLAARQRGINIPDGYQVTANGTLIESPGFDWKKAALILGGTVAGGMLAGYIVGGGVAAGAGGGGAAAAGGGTAAGVGGGFVGPIEGAAPIVGGAAAASAPSWLGPVIGAGANLAGTIYGANKQAGTSAEALKYAKEEDRYRYATEANRYAALMQGSQPFISTGGAADARMAELLGLPAPPKANSVPPPPTYGTPTIPGNDGKNYTPQYDPRGPIQPGAGYGLAADKLPAPAQTATGGTPAGQMITIQAPGPNGETRQVPASDEAMWIQRGATKVA